MKIAVIFFFSSLLFSLNGLSSNLIKFHNKVDSINAIINQTEDDTLKARAYLDLSEILYQSDLDTVIVLCETSIDIINNNLSQELSQQERENFMTTLAGAYNNIGFIYDDKGDVIKALEYYHKSLKIREELNDQMGIAVSLNNIGIIYVKQGQPNQALSYYLKSLKAKQKLGDQKSIATSLNNIAAVYKQLDEKKAIEYYTRALVLREEINDKVGMAVTLNNIGTVYKAKNSLDTALNYYSKAFSIRKKIGDKRGMTNTLANLGSIAFMKGDLTLSEEYGLEALSIAKDLGYTERIGDAAKLLGEVYQGQKKWKEAYQMKSLYVLMRDSVKNEETELDLIRQKAKYDMDKLMREKELLEKEKNIQELLSNRNRLIAISFIVAFILVLILVIIIYKGGRKKDMINELLEKQKTEAERKTEEKNTMLKEIHHRVKNSLQVISSLLRLQSNEFDDEYVKTKFEEAQNRVISIARLHEQMYNSENLKEININTHFTPLIEELVKDYQVNTKVKLDINLPHVNMGSKTLIPLGLMMNEIISNSLKYAFVDRKEGTIKVHITHLNENEYVLLIGDDGVGIPSDFDVEESSSLGMQLIHVFTEQLNGKIEQLTKKGAYFKITFENQKEDA